MAAARNDMAEHRQKAADQVGSPADRSNLARSDHRVIGYLPTLHFIKILTSSTMLGGCDAYVQLS
eukprot:scaffold178245_cov43-Prasinocladus_malaysianus.AAC.1